MSPWPARTRPSRRTAWHMPCRFSPSVRHLAQAPLRPSRHQGKPNRTRAPKGPLDWCWEKRHGESRSGDPRSTSPPPQDAHRRRRLPVQPRFAQAAGARGQWAQDLIRDVVAASEFLDYPIRRRLMAHPAAQASNPVKSAKVPVPELGTPPPPTTVTDPLAAPPLTP